MIYTVAKQNIGTPRTYKSQQALIRAVLRAGAHDVSFANDSSYVHVRWFPEDRDAVVSYPIDTNGVIHQQLAWDMKDTL